MQIGSNINTKYYPPYQSNKGEKNCTDIIADSSLEESTNYYELIKRKKEELLVKIQNGDAETAYQIGSQAFTEKEWDKLLDDFDSIEENMRELMRERHEKIEEKQKEQELIEE